MNMPKYTMRTETEDRKRKRNGVEQEYKVHTHWLYEDGIPFWSSRSKPVAESYLRSLRAVVNRA